MKTVEERIREIEDVLAKTPHHKATNKFIGLMRAKIAKLKDEFWQKGGGGGGGGGFAVAKTGDASVVLVGFPSVGKSTLINKLTNAQSKIGSYDFTTLDVVPGMMDYNGAKIQIFDLPGIIGGASSGKGRGKEVISVVRNANLIIIMVDPKYKDKVEQIKKELLDAGIRLDSLPPKISIIKLPTGGLKISSNLSLSFDFETIKEIAKEFRMTNGEIIIKEKITLDQLIDAFMDNRVYLPSLVILNKADLIPKNQRNSGFDLLISAEKNEGIEKLKELIWIRLNFARIYLKSSGKPPDMENPFIIKFGESLNNILARISICEKETFTKAYIFGPGSKFPNQEVSLSFIPQEGTIVEFSA